MMLLQTTTRVAVLAVALLTCPAAVDAAIKKDEVISLPGWSGKLPSRQWSGYLDVGPEKNRHLHYYFVESENEPATDPVTLWLNGGPGASSIAYGMMTEIGSLVFNRHSLVDNTTATPLLEYNRYGWARNSSMLYLESPAGVGFSYCDYTPCASNDTSTAEDAFDAVTAFFKGFPEHKAAPFYITGESYAGIYCPMLAEQIMNRGGVNLQGLAVGNGCWGNQVGTCGFSQDEVRIEMEYQFGHSMFSQRLYKQIKDTCKFPTPTQAGWLPPPGCQALIDQLHTQSGAKFWDNPNTYNFCPIEGALSEQSRMLKHRVTAAELDAEAGARADQLQGLRALGAGFEATGPLGEQQNWCGGPDAYRAWMALPALQEAWHVRPINPASAMKYTRAPAADLRPLYKTLAEKYRVWIYSGDSDGCVPHVGTEEWTADLGFAVADEWHPWVSDGDGANGTTAVIVGYTVAFGGASKDFRFATIMDSGHEVPTFKPVPAFAMLQRFWKGEAL